ncbi:MAG: ABC transporter permease [Opitutales bacterium]|nr:ABC transporter permease [Opitutales bacterium]
MKWWIYIAVKQLFPTGKRFSFFTLVSVVGVALGVLALFGTQSVMNGFHSEIGVKLVDTGGQVAIDDGGRVLSGKYADYLCEKLRAMPDVKKVEKVARGAVMMMNGNTPTYPILRSYDTLGGECALPLKEKNFIAWGDISELDDDSVILGAGVAARIGASKGDIVEVYAPTMLERLSKEEVPMPVKLEVAGFLSTGFSDVDKNIALVSLRRLQDLYMLGGGCHSIVLRLNDGVDETDFVKQINADLLRGGARAYTWLTGNEAFLRVIATEKVMMSVIIMLIIIVASFSICSSLYTTVLRKTKERGLTAAMGAQRLQIALSYCLQGFIIGLLGSLLGLALTFLLLENRKGIVEFIVGRDTLEQFYHFSNLPVLYDFGDAFRACLFAVILCTLAGLLPAWRASRLKASEAMRNE